MHAADSDYDIYLLFDCMLRARRVNLNERRMTMPPARRRPSAVSVTIPGPAPLDRGHDDSLNH